MLPAVLLLLLCCPWLRLSTAAFCRRHPTRHSDRQHVLLIEQHAFGQLTADTFDGVQQALPELDTLILRRVHISRIGQRAFGSLAQLQCLDLTTNSISSIQRGQLAGLPKLTALLLSNNVLNRIQPGAFSSTGRLVYLDLSSNALSVLEDTTFSGLQQLSSLDLSHNQLTSLPASVFQYIPLLQSLDVSHNPLVSVSIANLPILSVFVAYGCLFAQLPALPKSCAHADLRHNLLTWLPRQRAPELWRFTNVTLEVGGLLAGMVPTITALQGNPWLCTCDHYWFLHWMNYRLSQCPEPLLGLPIERVLDSLSLRCPAAERNATVQIKTLIREFGHVNHSQSAARRTIVPALILPDNTPAPPLNWIGDRSHWDERDGDQDEDDEDKPFKLLPLNPVSIVGAATKSTTTTEHPVTSTRARQPNRRRPLPPPPLPNLGTPDFDQFSPLKPAVPLRPSQTVKPATETGLDDSNEAERQLGVRAADQQRTSLEQTDPPQSMDWSSLLLLVVAGAIMCVIVAAFVLLVVRLRQEQYECNRPLPHSPPLSIIAPPPRIPRVQAQAVPEPSGYNSYGHQLNNIDETEYTNERYLV